MAKDTLGVLRQYDFSWGPNYTDNIYNITGKELAQSENVYYDGDLKPVPGTIRYIAATIAGTTHNITGLYQFIPKDQTAPVVVATDAGRVMADEGGGVWVLKQSGLDTGAKTYWNWTVFNNTLIGLSGKNVVKKWGGIGATMGDLGGTPPMSKYGVHHAVDFMFFAGHTSSPSELRYNDTADAETWPIGNSIIVGRDDNQIITGLQRFGDATVVFKNNSIWMVSGSSPDDFQVNPTPSSVGCVAPQSIVSTDSGIFFWSDAGPTLFNGFKSTLLGERMKGILDEIDWVNVDKIWAAYYPYRKQILVSYQRTGQSTQDRMLVLDLYRLGDTSKTPPVFWPVTVGGAQVLAPVTYTSTDHRRRIMLGHATGHVSTWDETATTFNGNTASSGTTITPRIRTGALHLGKLDHVQLVRDITIRAKAQTGQIRVRYAMDGARTFTTHTGTPYSTVKVGSDVHQTMLEGQGAGRYMVGNIIQLDIDAVGATGYRLHGYEIGTEAVSRREPL